MNRGRFLAVLLAWLLISGVASVAAFAQNPNRPPCNLSARALSGTSVRFSWDKCASYVDAFRIYKWNGSSWTLLRDRYASTTYDDNGLSPGTAYYYTVCSYYGATTKCADGFATVTTLSGAPLAPTGLSAYPSSSRGSIRFSWNQPCFYPPCVEARTYRIYRQRAGDSRFEEVASTFAQFKYWVDDTVQRGVKYYYTVCVHGDNGSACAANWVSATAN